MNLRSRRPEAEMFLVGVLLLESCRAKQNKSKSNQKKKYKNGKQEVTAYLATAREASVLVSR